MFKIKYAVWYRTPFTIWKGRSWKGSLHWFVEGEFAMSPNKQDATLFDTRKEAEARLTSYDGSNRLDERQGVVRIWLPWWRS